MIWYRVLQKTFEKFSQKFELATAAAEKKQIAEWTRAREREREGVYLRSILIEKSKWSLERKEKVTLASEASLDKKKELWELQERKGRQEKVTLARC